MEVNQNNIIKERLIKIIIDSFIKNPPPRLGL